MTAPTVIPITVTDPDAVREIERRRAELIEAFYPGTPKPTEKKARPKPRDWGDWVEDVEWMITNGESVGAIIQRTHLGADALAKRLQRHGRPDLASRFWRFAK
jgi:hypothetical protein